jgi:uncharacterized protein YkwD
METVAIRGRRTAAVALLLVVAFLAQGVRVSNANAATAQRDTMLSLTNEDRTSHQLAPLVLDNKLSRYAKQHSRDMAKTGYLFHTSDLAAKLQGLDWSLGGENVGVGSSLDGLESAFMNSPEHRDNILQKTYDHSAVGVFHDAEGNYWVTIIFYG